MKILVAGSRNWPKHHLTPVAFLSAFGDCEVVVGDCLTGVDAMVLAARPGAEVHRADWNLHGRAAGPIRNQKMVDSEVDLCLAFFWQERTRGTADCVERAVLSGCPVYEILRRW